MAKIIEASVMNFGPYCELTYTYDDGTVETEHMKTGYTD